MDDLFEPQLARTKTRKRRKKRWSPNHNDGPSATDLFVSGKMHSWNWSRIVGRFIVQQSNMKCWGLSWIIIIYLSLMGLSSYIWVLWDYHHIFESYGNIIIYLSLMGISSNFFLRFSSNILGSSKICRRGANNPTIQYRGVYFSSQPFTTITLKILHITIESPYNHCVISHMRTMVLEYESQHLP